MIKQDMRVRVERGDARVERIDAIKVRSMSVATQRALFDTSNRQCVRLRLTALEHRAELFPAR